LPQPQSSSPGEGIDLKPAFDKRQPGQLSGESGFPQGGDNLRTVPAGAPVGLDEKILFLSFCKQKPLLLEKKWAWARILRSPQPSTPVSKVDPDADIGLVIKIATKDKIKKHKRPGESYDKFFNRIFS